jgi:arylsulfatase
MYPAGWGWATNSPFQWAKQVGSHLGGTRNGLAIAWPGHLKDTGGVRTQFHVVSDIAPTIYEAAGIQAPARVNGVDQMPLDGISMAYTFDKPRAPDRRTSQIFEMNGHASYYEKGWMASSTPRVAPGAGRAAYPASALGRWELYDLSRDFSQAFDLARINPAKLTEMKDKFWREAGKQGILPFVDTPAGGYDQPPPAPGSDRQRYTFSRSDRRITGGVFPILNGRTWRLATTVGQAGGDADGTIVMGGGLDLAVDHNVPRVALKTEDGVSRIVAPAALPLGKHRIEVVFTHQAPNKAIMELLVDQKSAGKVAVDDTPSPFARYRNKSASVGFGFEQIDFKVAAPTRFTGDIDEVTLSFFDQKSGN